MGYLGVLALCVCSGLISTVLAQVPFTLWAGSYKCQAAFGFRVVQTRLLVDRQSGGGSKHSDNRWWNSSRAQCERARHVLALDCSSNCVGTYASQDEIPGGRNTDSVAINGIHWLVNGACCMWVTFVAQVFWRCWTRLGHQSTRPERTQCGSLPPQRNGLPTLLLLRVAHSVLGVLQLRVDPEGTFKPLGRTLRPV